jgi:ribosomal protein S12 methylthiotransferase accessory factor
MHVGLVGDGPAIAAAAAALEDVDATLERTTADRLAALDPDLAVVSAPAGASAFEFGGEDAPAPRWVAVEVGGVGGHPLDGVDAATSVYGPGSADYADLRARVASTTTEDELADAPRGDRSAVRLAGAVAGRRAVALLAGEDVAGTLVEVAGTRVGEPSTFLPVPGAERDRTLRRDHREASLDDALARAERAFDGRVGLVTDVGERESFPVPYYLAATADTRAFSDVRAAEFAAGVDPDWDAAFMKALGEALERYSAGVYRRSEFAVAPARGRGRAVAPDRFVRPDGARTPGPDEPVAWVPGEDLATGADVSLPAARVHYPPPDDAPGPSITTGLGLGSSGVEALLAGLSEVVERDATMLSWYSTYDPVRLHVDDDGFEGLVGRARAEGLTVTPLLVTVDVDVPVVAVAVHRGGEDDGPDGGTDGESGDDAAWPRFAAGSAASLDGAAAARSALAEALQNWMELRAMGRERAAAEEGAVARYAAFPAEARRFVDPPGAPVPVAAVGPEPVPSGEAALSALVDRVTDAGLEAYAARVTPPDVERLGFEAVRVLVPAAQPLFTGEPFFGERARTVPAGLGEAPRLDRDYHPYP